MDKASPNLSAKSASLPGYSNRGFHETYSSQQQSATPSYRSPLMQKERADKAVKVVVADPPPAASGGKKKKWSGWSGFFRRNKPAQQSAPVDGNSSDETGHLASGHQQKTLPASPPPTTSDDANKNKKTTTTTASRFLHPPRNLSKDRSPVVDTLSPLQSDLSASQTSLSRKERRDAILARAQARRNGGSAGGSSSDEADKDGAHLLAPSPSYRRHHHHSQESLTSNGSSCRAGHPKSRTGRTERYLQRRSRDDESLRREMQQQQQPYCADYDWSASTTAQLNPSSSRRWLLTASSASSIPGSWGGAHHPETTATQSNGNQRVGESPVTLRKPTYSNNNSPMQVVRAQSALVTHPKLSTPPPPPPRNPLKKSYLLQVQSNEPSLQLPLHSGRPTSYSFGELRFAQQQPSLHDYQNVDQDGRLVPTTADRSAVHLPLTSPVQRRILNSSPHMQPAGPSRHHSTFFPKSPSPYLQKTPEQERSKPPPWLASAAPKSIGSAPPVREFWRSKDQVQQQQQTPSTKSARERLAPFHLTGNGSVSSLNSDLSSPMSRDAATTNSSGDCPPFYMATGNTLASINGPGVIPPTPRRIPVVAHNNNNNNNVNNSQPHHVRELSQLKPSTDKHLEQAICELEQIYRSLKLDGDEDLLDRAERRDLPTAHQQLIQQQYTTACSGSESGGDPLGHGITSDLDTMMNWSISGSFENLAATSERIRTPANRRSAVPDKVADDMAVRRLAAAARKSTANDPQLIAAQSGSYLLLSPSITAATGEDHDGSSRSGSCPDEPDVIYDDVAYRQIRQANQSLKVAEPQPPFGIPIGPVTPASPSDYLHTSVTPEQFELRPLLHPTKYPDLVRDDLAFRNLRKDAGQLQLPPGPVNTDKLDDILQETGFSKSLKKKRAVRSLSANIAQLIRKDASRPSGGGGVVDYNRQDDEEEDERYIGFNPFDSRAQSLSDLLDDSPVFSNNNNNIQNKSAKTPRAVKQRSGLKRIGKSVEADDVDAIVQRQVRPLASWVERAHLSDVAASSTETITAERVPALAKLYPTSALMANKSPKPQVQQTADLEMDHLISELSECGGQAGRSRQVDSSGLQLALKPPTGVVAGANEVGSPASVAHYWEESPLFQSQPQFQFPQQRSASPANSSDSGQVSCCAREVRQILHHQIRQEERERERLASLAAGEVSPEPGIVEPALPHEACSSPCLPVEATWMAVHEPVDTTTQPAFTVQPTQSSPSPIVADQTDWALEAGPGSDDGIDSLPARSSERGSSTSRSGSPDEDWSNSSRQLSSSSSSSSDEDDDEPEMTSLCQTTARWLSISDQGKALGTGGLAGTAHGWLSTHIVHQVVCAGCILTSLLTLCGLDLATCAHLLLALLALAAVFCDMHWRSRRTTLLRSTSQIKKKKQLFFFPPHTLPKC